MLAMYLTPTKALQPIFVIFYSTVGKKMAEKFRGVKSKTENPYMGIMVLENSFSLTEVTLELREKQLDYLDVEKATGLDKISYKSKILKVYSPDTLGPFGRYY